MAQCPFDPGHKVPVSTMEKHKASCKLRKMGYSAEEQVQVIETRIKTTIIRNKTL